jgi:hypothetical protein
MTSRDGNVQGSNQASLESSVVPTTREVDSVAGRSADGWISSEDTGQLRLGRNGAFLLKLQTLRDGLEHSPPARLGDHRVRGIAEPSRPRQANYATPSAETCMSPTIAFVVSGRRPRATAMAT